MQGYPKTTGPLPTTEDMLGVVSCVCSPAIIPGTKAFCAGCVSAVDWPVGCGAQHEQQRIRLEV